MYSNILASLKIKYIPLFVLSHFRRPWTFLINNNNNNELQWWRGNDNDRDKR